MSIRDLQQLLAPPTAPVDVPTDRQWSDTEAALGVALPSDYRDYLNTYGSGRIGDFLDIFNPASPRSWDGLLARLDQQRPVFESMQGGRHPLSYGLHPARPGLLPLGQTDNGDMLFYLINGEAEGWKVAFFESRGADVVVFDAGLTAFLVAGLRHEMDVFPDSVSTTFTPVKP